MHSISQNAAQVHAEINANRTTSSSAMRKPKLKQPLRAKQILL